MRVVWITATPRVAATGATTTVRLAGGGASTAFYRGGNHYRAGVVAEPRFKAELGFDENGWTGGTVPTTGALVFKPAQRALLDELGGLLWNDAAVTVETGPEGGPYSTVLTGTIANAAEADHGSVLTLVDLSKAVDRPLITARFAGSGGVEGGTEAAGRVKRRTWGRAYNVEGRVLDKANNVFEFGDLAFPWQAIDIVRDKGRDAAPAVTVLAWQGSVAATLTALKAAVCVGGSGVVAPSICCAKWWAQPVGPLTADVRGEIGTGYVETAPEIAARVAAAGAGPAIANVSAMAAVRAAAAGLHVGDDSETTAQALDRLLLGVSLLWLLEPAGTIRLREWTFAAPVASLTSRDVRRLRSFAPVKTRRLGYQRSYRTHGDAEISAILQVGDVAGLGDVATEDYLYFGSPTLKEALGGATATLLNFKTPLGIAADFAGRGALATKNKADLRFDTTGYLQLGVAAAQIADESNSFTLTNNNTVTQFGMAADFAGRGALATKNKADLRFDTTGYLQLGVAAAQIADDTNSFTLTNNNTVTQFGVAADFVGRGAFATLNAVSLEDDARITNKGRIAKLNTAGRVSDPLVYNTQAIIGLTDATNLVPAYTNGASNVTINLPGHVRKVAGPSGPQPLSYGATQTTWTHASPWWAYIDDVNLVGVATPTIGITADPSNLLYPGRYRVAEGITPAAPSSGGGGGGFGGGGYGGGGGGQIP